MSGAEMVALRHPLLPKGLIGPSRPIRHESARSLNQLPRGDDPVSTMDAEPRLRRSGGAISRV